MKIAAWSDGHGLLPEINKSDVLCIAGDISPLEIQRNLIAMETWFIEEFLPWCEKVPVKKIILTAGNHDFFFQNYSKIRALIAASKVKRKLTYLENEGITYKDVTFYGTPWCTGPNGWAFVGLYAQSVYNTLPECDILLTHQPPQIKKLGCSFPYTSQERDFGSKVLAQNIIDKNINITICGHIHTGESCSLDNHQFYNVSLLNESYKPYKNVTYFEYEKDNFKLTTTVQYCYLCRYILYYSYWNLESNDK